MNCINHSDTEAVAVCTKCGAPVCFNCKCTLDNAVVCPSCLLMACKARALESYNQEKTYLIYIFLAAIVYVAGLLCALIGKDDTALIIIGLLIMGIPNITFMFKMQFLLIAGIGTRIILAILCILAGVITTPVFIIKSAIGYGKYEKNRKYWAKLHSDCIALYPFLTGQTNKEVSA